MSYNYLDISSVKVGDRVRKDIGDLQPLIKSISDTGLLHPIVIDEKNNLVAGYRRLMAFKQMGETLIPITKLSISDILRAELDENKVRKDFTFEEEMKIADYFEPKLKKEAEKRKQETQGRPKKTEGKLPSVSKEPQTRDQLGAYFNESGKTFEKKRALWTAFQNNHPRSEYLKEKMEKTSVNSAYAVLKIYERRQKVEDAIAKDAKARNALPSTIHFGDFFKLGKELKQKSIDSTVTSPPFVIEKGNYLDWYCTMLVEIERVTIDYALIFNSSTNLVEICAKTHPDRVLIWNKQITQEPFRYEPILVYRFSSARFNINANITHDVFTYSTPQSLQTGGRIHVFQNPPELYEELVKLTQAKVVMDPFLGSGTTFKVCSKLGKTCVGFEINETYRPAIEAPLLEKKKQ